MPDRQGAKAPRVVFTDPNFWISRLLKRGQDRTGAKAPRRQGLFSLTPTFGLHAGRSREVKTGSDHRVCTTTGAKAPRRQGLFSLAPTFGLHACWEVNTPYVILLYSIRKVFHVNTVKYSVSICICICMYVYMYVCVYV